MTRLLSILGSRVLTVFIIAVGIIYYITIAVWAKEAFASLMGNLKSDPLFIFAASLLFTNITIRAVWAFFRIRNEKMKMFLRFPLIAGLIIFLFAFLMSNAFRQFQWKVVGVNDVLDFGKGKVFRVTHINPALKNEVINIKGEGGIFSYEPTLRLMDRDGMQYEVGAYPPTKIKGIYMHVLQFGIAPGIKLIERNTVVAKGYMAMRLLPFGATDSFEIPPFVYRFNLIIRPDRTIRKGNEVAYHYDVERPLYRVMITKGDKMVAQAETRTGITFDDVLQLNFFKPDYWIMLETVSDPFLPFFIGGMGLLSVGIVLYPFSFLIREKRDGSSVVALRHL